MAKKTLPAMLLAGIFLSGPALAQTQDNDGQTAATPGPQQGPQGQMVPAT